MRLEARNEENGLQYIRNNTVSTKDFPSGSYFQSAIYPNQNTQTIHFELQLTEHHEMDGKVREKCTVLKKGIVRLNPQNLPKGLSIYLQGSSDDINEIVYY